jgi:hypothetical protein
MNELARREAVNNCKRPPHPIPPNQSDLIGEEVRPHDLASGLLHGRDPFQLVYYSPLCQLYIHS